MNRGGNPRHHSTPGPFPERRREKRIPAVMLELSDEYVWIYSDVKPQWWTEEGKPLNIPAAYFEALRRARKRLTAE